MSTVPNTTSGGNGSHPLYIDVSKISSDAMDYRSPIWWGNALLLCIETSMFMILISSYFYFRTNFDTWPPPKVDVVPPIYDPVPHLPLATVNLAILLLSIIPMTIAQRACLTMNEPVVKIAATLGVLMAIAAIVLRFKEFGSLIFRWDDNAYGSITWAILGVHLMHLVIMAIEDGLMAVYVWVKGLDDKHARDIRVTAVYWYWVVAIWVVLYLLIYWYPRWTH
jgi:heme/copper-type cytochrome/quinol oxidase subunit 3